MGEEIAGVVEAARRSGWDRLEKRVGRGPRHTPLFAFRDAVSCRDEAVVWVAGSGNDGPLRKHSMNPSGG